MASSAANRVSVLRAHLEPAEQPRHSVRHQATSATAAQPSSALQQLSGPLLKGQVAIITGSGQGMGAAAAQLFALHGARVVVSDLDKAKSDQVAEEICSRGGEAVSIPGDMLDAAFPAELVRKTADKFGALHIIVNNAGFTADAMLHKTTQQQWDLMLAMHATAPFRLIQAASKLMRDAAKRELEEQGAAHPRAIVNVSSAMGVHGNVGQANYSSGKAAVLGLTRTVAKEWGGFNVRCNAVAYGFINTRLTQAQSPENSIQIGGHSLSLGLPGDGMAAEAAAQMYIPLKRIGSVAEGAGPMLFMASPLSGFVSGQVLEVDGGQFM